MSPRNWWTACAPASASRNSLRSTDPGVSRRPPDGLSAATPLTRLNQTDEIGPRRVREVSAGRAAFLGRPKLDRLRVGEEPTARQAIFGALLRHHQIIDRSSNR